MSKHWRRGGRLTQMAQGDPGVEEETREKKRKRPCKKCVFLALPSLLTVVLQPFFFS